MASAPTPGRTVSHYQLVSKLGEGGMGLVFKAVDKRLGRQVAIKFLAHRLLSSQEATQRFEREARTVSSLNHPNIATLFDVGVEGDQPYLVLEYLGGGSLHERIHGRQLPVEEIVAYAEQIAKGLAHAHNAGVVHRDLKPGNVMLAAPDQLKLVDFGLSKFRVDAGITSHGARVGTVAYMAPEQARGAEIDHRADIFSLGVMLYEFAAGRRPFRADHDESLVYQIVHEDPAPLEELRPGLPECYCRTVKKAMAKDPADRYQSVAELIGDLEPLGVKVSSVPKAIPPTVTYVPERVRRSRRLALIAAAALLAVVVSLLLWRPWRSEVPEQKHIAVLPFENLGGDPANQAFCDGLMETLASNLSQVERFQQSLWVVPASEIRPAAVKSIQDARQKFSVTLAITGSVQRTGNEIRVIVTLSDAKTLRQLASRVIGVPRDGSPKLDAAMLADVVSMLDLSVGPLAGADKPRDPQAYDFYQEGQGYLQRRSGADVLKAIERLEKAVSLDADYALARAALSTAYYRHYVLTDDTQFLAKADAQAARAIVLNDKLPQAHAAQGTIFNGTGRYRDAAAEFRRALELDPSNADVRRNYALAQRKLGNVAEAEAAFKEAIRLKPGYWPSYGSLGSFYFDHGDYAKAEAALKTVVELAPENSAGYENLASVCIMTDRLEEARKLLDKAVALGPTSHAYSNLGNVHFAMKQWKEAVAAYQKAVDLRPRDPINWGNLADAWGLVEGGADKARETFNKAIELGTARLALDPNDAGLRSSVAVYYAKSGGKDKAREHIAAAIKRQPENVRVLYNAARVYAVIGDHARAVDCLRRAVKRGYSTQYAEMDPDLAGLREDPRVRELLAKPKAK